MKKRLFAIVAPMVMAAFVFTSPPAKADTFNETIMTNDRVNGYDITVIGLTTDPSNVATSITSATIVGFGADVGFNGSLSLVGPTSPLQGPVFLFDGKAFASPDYFSRSGTSGIVLALAVGAGFDYFNPYLDPGSSNYFSSISLNGAGPSNPGDQVTIATTPLPGTAVLFISALVGLGALSRKRKKPFNGQQLAGV